MQPSAGAFVGLTPFTGRDGAALSIQAARQALSVLSKLKFTWAHLDWHNGHLSAHLDDMAWSFQRANVRKDADRDKAAMQHQYLGTFGLDFAHLWACSATLCLAIWASTQHTCRRGDMRAGQAWESAYP